MWPLAGKTALVWGAAGPVGRMLVALLCDGGTEVIGIASGERVEAVRGDGGVGRPSACSSRRGGAAGRLSFAFLEGTPFRRWAFRSGANGPPVAGRLPGWSEVAARHRGSSQRRLPTARDLTRRRELWQGR